MANEAKAKQASQPQPNAKKFGKVGPAHACKHFAFSQGSLHGTAPCPVGTQIDLSEAVDVLIGYWLLTYAVLQKRAREADPCESGDAANKKAKGKSSKTA